MRVDREVISELERSMATVEARIVDAYESVDGDPARARPFGAGWLITQGPGRFVNRAIGVSLDDDVIDRLDELDAFFADAGVAAGCEVSSWAPPAVARALATRGFQPDWFGEMFVAMPSSLEAEPVDAATSIELVSADTLRGWQDVFAAGFDYHTTEQRMISDRHTATVLDAAGAEHFVAIRDGQPAGCGSLYLDGDIAWIGGGATVPQSRGRGIQRTLLAHRRVRATAAGCDRIAATAIPSSGSSRNLRRAGFTPAHTRVIMTRPG